MKLQIYYIHDPMCSWCWAFQRGWQRLRSQLPAQLQVVRLLGGLAADSSETMAPEVQRYIQQTWRRIEQRVEGVEFNHQFWQRCRPQRSTYGACRAVIAARNQGADNDEAMTQAIQHAYYRQARNPSEQSTLIELATELGLDGERFSDDLKSEQTAGQLQAEIAQCRNMGGDSFPSLLLNTPAGRWSIPIDYNRGEGMLEAIRALL